ncbi:MAG TPA: tetratricopeptide repeat protein [Pseudolabrys sp.]|nr:tetratricopeptide repeat protein [Pseudolabrys sp.]
MDSGEQRLRDALTLHGHGRLAEAAKLYNQIIHNDPNNHKALHYFGALKAASGDLSEAKELMERSLQAAPDNIGYVENYVALLFQTGAYEAAIEICERVINECGPTEALRYSLAVSLHKARLQSEALSAFDKLLAAYPNHLAGNNEKASVLAQVGKYEEALQFVNRALTLQPRYAEAYLNKGNIFAKLKRHREAIVAYRTASSLNQDIFDAYLGLGSVFWDLGRYEDALAANAQALKLKPNLPSAWLARGNIFRELRRFDEALASYDKTLQCEPHSVEAYVARGNLHIAFGYYERALADYDKALEYKPEFADAWIGRGTVLFERKRYEDALAAFDKALMLDAKSERAWLGRGNVFFALGLINEALAAYDHALALNPDFETALVSKIFTLDFSAEASFQDQQDARSKWWQQFGQRHTASISMVHDNSRDTDRRLKIGYVSADFRRHSAGFAVKPLLANHNKEAFAVICYNCNIRNRDDDFTESFKSLADSWVDASSLSDEELARKIRSDHIDILVDLAGHSAGNRLNSFAAKPAPIQITAWGHANGTGLPTIDYLFSDPVTIPQAVRHHFAEKIYDLPCLIMVDPLPTEVSRGGLPAMRNGYCTFGCFNRASKISRAALAAWARLLKQMPHARLLLKDPSFEADSVKAAIRQQLSDHGIVPDCVQFAGWTSREEHLTAYNRVDICLDSFPHTGGVSTWEALQMGVPVVTQLGNNMASRISGGILMAIGLSECVTNDTDGYIAQAATYARDFHRLAELREKLPTVIASSQAGDPIAYTRAVENAYRTMWRDYCRS